MHELEELNCTGSAVNKYAAKNGLKQHLYPPAIHPGKLGVTSPLFVIVLFLILNFSFIFKGI